MDPIILTVNNKTIRLRQLDERNLVIEHKEPKGWRIFRYYGKVEDLASGLIDLLIVIPEASDLATQISLMRQQVQDLGKELLEQIKSSHGPYSAESGQKKVIRSKINYPK